MLLCLSRKNWRWSRTLAEPGLASPFIEKDVPEVIYVA